MIIAETQIDLAAALSKALLLEKAPIGDLHPLEDSKVKDLQEARASGRASEWHAKGIAALRAGKVAVLTLAGGQGTRLGSSAPKGCFSIGLPSGKSLFQLQAERIRRLEEHQSARIMWLVMTSPATDTATREHFAQHGHFGKSPESIRFFQQAMLPALHAESGKVIKAIDGSMVLSPNGNGGIFRALSEAGLLGELTERGITAVHMYCVDNALAKPADPTFLGMCVEGGVEAGVKSVLRHDPREKVGVFVRGGVDGQVIVAEYSELPAELADGCDGEGRLLFREANIANHYFTIPFLRRVASIGLPYHAARKSIPVGDGKKVDGIKLEQFIFDVLRFTETPTAVLRVPRGEEFAPLKNATGLDSPETCREAVLRLHAKWVNVEKGEGGEVSSLNSYEGEE